MQANPSTSPTSGSSSTHRVRSRSPSTSARRPTDRGRRTSSTVPRAARNTRCPIRCRWRRARTSRVRCAPASTVTSRRCATATLRSHRWRADRAPSTSITARSCRTGWRPPTSGSCSIASTPSAMRCSTTHRCCSRTSMRSPMWRSGRDASATATLASASSVGASTTSGRASATASTTRTAPIASAVCRCTTMRRGAAPPRRTCTSANVSVSHAKTPGLVNSISSDICLIYDMRVNNITSDIWMPKSGWTRTPFVVAVHRLLSYCRVILAAVLANIA